MRYLRLIKKEIPMSDEGIDEKNLDIWTWQVNTLFLGCVGNH